MSDTPKGSPGSTSGKGGQDPRRNKGRSGIPVPPPRALQGATPATDVSETPARTDAPLATGSAPASTPSPAPLGGTPPAGTATSGSTSSSTATPSAASSSGTATSGAPFSAAPSSTAASGSATPDLTSPGTTASGAMSANPPSTTAVGPGSVAASPAAGTTPTPASGAPASTAASQAGQSAVAPSSSSQAPAAQSGAASSPKPSDAKPGMPTPPPGGNGPSGPRPPGSTPPGPPAAAPRRDRDRWILPIAAGGGVVVLLVAWMIVSNRPGPAIDPARVDALESRIEGQGAALQQADQRLGALETALREREPISLEALNTLRSRLDRQEGTLADQQRRTEAQIAETENAFSQRITGAEAQLAQRVAAAEAALAPKLASLETTMQQRLAAAEQAARQQAETQQQQINARFATLEQREARIVAAEQRLNRLVASTALTTALEAGKPLGAALAGLPGIPPAALTRYSDTAPPTMAALRLSFEDAARAARAAAEPATEGQGVLEAAATRLSNLVTIRRGESVVWGDAISGELEGARQALNAGDVAAAVQKVEALPEAVRTPMAGWLAQAKGLLEARNALGELMATPRGQG